MNKTVNLLFHALEEKNSYLLEFHKLNMEELNRLSEGCTDHLENFYYSREILLQAINKLDSDLSKKNWNESLNVNQKEKNRLLDIFQFKKKMILSILDQDLAIISLIDKIKKNNIKAIA